MIFLEERIGKLVEELEQLVYPESVPIEGFRMLKTGEKFSDIENLDSSSWEVVGKSGNWGGHREYYWFDCDVIIPAAYIGKCVIFEMTTGKENGWDAINPQFTIYVNGKLRQGLDVNHRSIILSERATAGEHHRLTLSAFTGDQNEFLQFLPVMKVLDRLTERYFYDISVPFQVAVMLDKQDQAYIDTILTLNESLNLLDLRQPGSEAYYQSISRAQEYLSTAFYQRLCGHKAPLVQCVGHTHIDVAWLWTLAVTREKAVRSFSTVLALMEEFPEYIFMSSQPQLYKFVQKDAPEVFEQIKARIREGRWEAEGGMFLEADCNLASGEALVRQFLTGIRYFQKEFGVENKILWLPDVFGYSAALPQILKQCGIPYFMTTKISWNEFNKVPYDTFEWSGIDGSRVLTHFIPAMDYESLPVPSADQNFRTTYNAQLNPSQVKGGWQRYQQKHLNSEVLMSFGFGDGGGGPTREMLENHRRLALGIPGCPRTKMSTARAFFEKLEEDVRGNKYLPVWKGELYLEFHRGTYTTMARNKKFNRQSEFAWQNAESYSAMNALLNQVSYPAEEIHEGWEVVLRNQFHDILPGSSIKEVYDDSKAEYEETLKTSHHLAEAAMRSIASRLAAETHAGASCLTVFNPNGLAITGPVEFSVPPGIDCPVLSDGAVRADCQKTESGWLACVPEIPSKGYQIFEVLDRQTDPRGMVKDNALIVATDRLSNQYLDIRLDQKGQFTSVFDKRAGCELLPAGTRANVIMSYEDKPLNHDAWDINHYYREKSWEIDDVQSIRITETGPVRACLEIRRRYLSSSIIQKIFIWRDLGHIDIRHEIDWREKQILLKWLVPTDINSNQATFDIQYGNVQRPTHSNTSWDIARFEVCMHKWMDISEDNFGVSILNDCKYGCSVQNGVIGVSMLKSAVWPNPEADKEHHVFTLSLMPHIGGWREAGTVRAAYALNNPLAAIFCEKSEKSDCAEKPVYSTPKLPRSFSFVKADRENVVIEVVKQAEDSQDWIVRCFECFNRRTSVRLTFARPVEWIRSCDLLENDTDVLQPVENDNLAGCSVDLVIRPYEIRTVKVRFW